MSNWAMGIVPRLASSGLDKRLPVVVLLLLMVLLAQGMAQMTWELLPVQPQEPLLIPTRVADASPSAGKSTPANSAQISQWHLFGDASQVVAAPIAKVVDAPDTQLNLKLLGVLASSDPVAARAIIADGKGIEEAYAIDASLPGNAVLREIYVDRVILEYRGRMETLRLPREEQANVEVSPDPVSAAPGRAVQQAGTTDNASLLREYRDALINNPQSLMNLVSASPVIEKDSGQLKGYRIRPGKDKELLGRFGLKSGDVVTGVNGVALNNPIKALEIMRDLSTATSVTLEVERNGVMESFAFHVD
ncbi:MAG: type II secretion system protein GspC [Gammaproteobacteria bacterium]|nr:type II secretion system protein GspC [Gammaproteobacteria bacterium]